ncbi:hypothetical protein T492DRAFT_1089474 [Pavlovales sp. CCMP2436]|nr:hypothetical protein T492DRAFT_1089474 [Pavlovales sp. CCMP2436]
MDEPFSELAMLLGRAFYEDLEILVLDKLVALRQALTDKELGEVLHLSERHVRKGLVALLRDRLVSKQTVKLADLDEATATAAEFRERQRTLGEKTFFYVELGAIPDLVKFKVHLLRKRTEAAAGGGAAGGEDVAAWKCARCDLTFSEADAWSLYDRDRQVFTCESCGEPIEEATEKDAHLSKDDKGGGEEWKRRLDVSLAPLLVALGRCDKSLEEGRDAPPLLQPTAAAAAADGAVGGVGGGGGGKRPRTGEEEAAANGEPSLTVEIATSAGAAAGAAGAAKSAVRPTLFWQADTAEAARKRSREEADAEAAAAEGATRAAADADWAEQLQANQQRQQRERARLALGGAAVGEVRQPAQAVAVPAAAATAPQPSLGAGAGAEEEDDEWEDEGADVVVTVQGVAKPLSEVTDEDTERMTSDEFQRYHALAVGN